MPFEPDPPFPKSKGDSLRSADWNAMIREVERLSKAYDELKIELEQLKKAKSFLIAAIL